MLPLFARGINTRLLTAAVALCVAATLPAMGAGSRNNNNFDGPLVSQDTKNRLSEIETRRRELQERISQTRKQEQLAFLRLHKIQTKLNVTNGALHKHQENLERTEVKINECENKIERTKSAEETLSEQASDRLKQIYEGERLSFIEMLFQVDSLRSLIDRMYYQERVAEMDRTVLDELRAKSALLAQSKDRLGLKKRNLGDLVSEFAEKAMQIAKEKLTQQDVAERLSKQRAMYEESERQLAQESQRLETEILQMESSNKRSVKNIQVGSGSMAMPLHAPITSPFGMRVHPIFRVRKFHTGIDLAGPNHSAIRAADSGNVLFVGWYGGYGKVVIISHGQNLATLYAHMSRTAATVGQNVQKGDIVGYEGTTGFSTGPHLHFEVRVQGKPSNPLMFLR